MRIKDLIEQVEDLNPDKEIYGAGWLEKKDIIDMAKEEFDVDLTDKQLRLAIAMLENKNIHDDALYDVLMEMFYGKGKLSE